VAGVTKERGAEAQRDAKEQRGARARRRAATWLAFCAVALFVALTFRGTMTRGISVGDPVDGLGLLTLDHEPASLVQWRGQGLILRLSSTSCVTCPSDFALLEQWQQELGDQVQVIAVQVGDTAADVRAALMGAQPKVPVLLDPDGEAARRLGLKQIPSVYFVTARGTLSSVSNVEIARTDVATHVRTLLAGGPNIEAEVRAIARLLQCPECEGRSVWESDSRSSWAMREEIRALLLAGRRPDEVLRHFAEEYGEWILLAPSPSGLGALAWLLPGAGFLLGAGLWALLLARARGRARGRADGGASAQAAPVKKERLARRIDEYM